MSPVPRRTLVSIIVLAASVVTGGALSAVGARGPLPQADTGAPKAPGENSPSDAEVSERAAKLIENQHKDDVALEVYERMEHEVDRTTGASTRIILDKTYRVVPTGGGTMKLLIADHGMPVDPKDYLQQLGTLRGILETMANPNDSRAKAAYEKYQKRQHERADFLEMARTAFVVKWQDREVLNGRMCDVFTLTPDPNFHPHSIYQSAMAHVAAKIWVDRETSQLVRGEANVTSDTYFGGGLLGKLSRGSKVSMDQTEVAPGLWLPADYRYDFSGRKFLFSFEQHQSIEASHYRRIGPPVEALAAIEEELANGKPAAGDP
jgi:hypothetical protein